MTASKRRLRRRPAAALLLFFVLALLWLAWWRVAAHRLAQATAAMAQAGAPIEPPDTPPAALPPEQNAATYYRQAIAAMAPNIDSPSNSSLSFNGYPPFPPAWYQMTDAAVAANGPVLAAARKAREFAQGDWGYAVASYGVYTPAYSASLNQSRHLANFLADAAVHAHLHDDDVEAIGRIDDELHLARTISQRTDVIGRLVSIGIESMALSRLELIAPDLKITEGDSPSTQPQGAVSRRTLRRLIDELLDERDERRTAREDFITAIRTESQMGRELRGHMFPVRPMIDLEIARMLRTRWGELLAMQQQNWPDAEALLPPEQQSRVVIGLKDADPPRYSHVISDLVWMPIPRYVVSQFKAIAERRAAAAALAIQLYRADHHRWPQTLDELVTDYLPAVPLDPFLPGKEPIKYIILRGELPDGGDRPMIRFDWRYGDDSSKPPTEPTFGITRGWQWRDLSRWYPPAPATSQTGGDQ